MGADYHAIPTRVSEMRLRYYAAVAFNWLQGCRFFWATDKHGRYMDMTEKCCPYPLRFDWSAKACIKAGDCGCSKRYERRPQNCEGKP